MMASDGPKTEETFSVFEALGMMMSVAMDSHYSDWSISEVEKHIVPALKSGQYKVYCNNQSVPVAFVTWALLDDECHEAMLTQARNPPADRWAAGKHLWVMDLVAPYGDAQRVGRDLQRNLFPDMLGHAIRRDPDGRAVRIAKWRGRA